MPFHALELGLEICFGEAGTKDKVALVFCNPVEICPSYKPPNIATVCARSEEGW